MNIGDRWRVTVALWLIVLPGAVRPKHRGVPVQKLPHFENQARRGGPMKARKAATMASTAGGVPVPAGTTKTL
jgi:hypothetical protein